MDVFKVPKKVNRHVIKAINILKNENSGPISTDEILDQVKYQMRNLVPVPNIEMTILKSLKNLSDIGVIEKKGKHAFKTAPAKNRHSSKPSGSRKRSYSHLKPNSKIRSNYDSDESLSGNEYKRTGKRMYTNNKKIKFAGRKTDLNKTRPHTKRTNSHFTVDFLARSFSPSDEINFEQNIMSQGLPILNVCGDLSFEGASTTQRLSKDVIFNDDFFNVSLNQASPSTSIQGISEKSPLTIEEVLYDNDLNDLPKDSNVKDQESNSFSSKSKLMAVGSTIELNSASKSQMNNSVEN